MEAKKDVEIAARTLPMKRENTGHELNLKAATGKKISLMILAPAPKPNMIPKKHISRLSWYLPCMTADCGAPRYARLRHGCARQNSP